MRNTYESPGAGAGIMENGSGGEPAPSWVVEEVLPAVEGPVRSVQMLTDRSAIVFASHGALVAEKGKLGGVRIYRADYPAGFLVSGAKCPHCGQGIQEPIGKTARRVDDAAPETPEARSPPEPMPGAESGLTEKQLAQRKYAGEMRGVRARAAKGKGGKGPVRERGAAKALRKKHGLK